jgi:hypothetical protein
MNAAHLDDEINPFASVFCGPYAEFFEEPPAPAAVCRQAAAAGDPWKGYWAANAPWQRHFSFSAETG